ncbi:MAG: acetyl-CoA carboxylase biotin carboxyl carrier protein [Acidobacteriota bacterium]
MDLSELKDILRILEEQEITEFELEHDGVKLRVCRSSPPVAARPAPPGSVLAAPPSPAPPAPVAGAVDGPAAGAAASGDAMSEDATEESEANGDSPVPSPIVGTFYRAPDPNSPPFVNVGDRVQVGQVLCIIEAMKLMNEIEAEVAGEIVKIHAENGQPVQYGDPLFTVRPA